MTSSTAHVWMLPGGPAQAKRLGIGPVIERFLLEQFNLSLGNSGLEDEPGLNPQLYPDGKFIIPMFGYPESRKKWFETYNYFRGQDSLGDNVYMYDCGDGDDLGTDEPWTRVKGREGADSIDELDARRILSWGMMLRRVKDALIDYPGLKPVITHPRAGGLDVYPYVPTVREMFGSEVAYGFDAHVIEWARHLFDELPEHIAELTDWREVLDIPPDAEVWAYFALYERCGVCTHFDINAYAPCTLTKQPVTYDNKCEHFALAAGADPYRADWMKHWTPTPLDKPWLCNQWAEERGVKCLLINTNLSPLIDEAAGDPRKLLRPNAVQYLTGREVV